MSKRLEGRLRKALSYTKGSPTLGLNLLSLCAEVGVQEAALQATTTALGEHHCGVCCNFVDGEDQPYHAVTERETCDGCRGNWKAWRAGKDLLDE